MVVQTVFLHSLSPCCRSFDMLMPLVAYLSVCRPVPESVALAVVFGAGMDALSGGPFGFYIVTYVWLFFGVRGSMKFLDAGSYFLFPLILMAGMVMENLLFSLSTSRAPAGMMVMTALATLVTAPFFLLFFNALFRRVGRITARLALDRQG